jgi:hypothetical protein
MRDKEKGLPFLGGLWYAKRRLPPASSYYYESTDGQRHLASLPQEAPTTQNYAEVTAPF